MRITRTARERERQRTFARLERLYREGRYEEVEAGAQALAATSWRDRFRPVARWERQARTLATGVAVAHGRGDEVLAELETLIAELEPVDADTHVLQLVVRANRTVVLIGQERHEEAEAESLDILRAVTRLAHLTRCCGSNCGSSATWAGPCAGRPATRRRRRSPAGTCPARTSAPPSPCTPCSCAH